MDATMELRKWPDQFVDNLEMSVSGNYSVSMLHGKVGSIACEEIV